MNELPPPEAVEWKHLLAAARGRTMWALQERAKWLTANSEHFSDDPDAWEQLYEEALED